MAKEMTQNRKAFILAFLAALIFLSIPTASAWTNTSGGDHNGTDWIISTNTEVAGYHYNFTNFTINSGVTATVAAYGTGAWNYTYTWNASGTQNSVQKTGLHWDATDGSDNNLFAIATFTSTNLLANDQLKVIWSISVN